MRVACTKINVEKNILHWVRIQQGYPKSAIKASENHVGVKRGVTFKNLSCSRVRSVLYGLS